MRSFSHIEYMNERIKCHYPGCYMVATQVMIGPMYTLLLCDEHAATERYIASTENSPQQEKGIVDVSIMPYNQGESQE